MPSAITNRQRRKHSDRVLTLPPCDPTMDLMIEAKDKEQAVFELMRTFKLPGHDLFNDIIPYTRTDENKPFKPPRKSPKKNGGFVDLEALVPPPQDFPEEEVGMGGPERRVYWPPTMEEWLRPKKVIRAKATQTGSKKTGKAAKATNENDEPENEDGNDTPKTPTRKTSTRKTGTSSVKKPAGRKRKASGTPDSTPSPDAEEADVPDVSETAPARRSGRAKKMNYAEESESAG